MPGQERPRSYSSDLSTSSPNFFRGPAPDPGPFTPIDHLSSLESDDHYVPGALPIIIIPYEPIPIPREPTLEDILREAASDSTELDQVTHLKLCVISDDLSLQRVAAYCPLLTSLNLEGSALNTLRELGCMLINLRYLDVSRCNLRSLDGTSGLGSVTHLVANSNQIEYLDPCSFLDELQELSVQGNVIRTTYNLHCLSLCPLRTLHINGNPIEEEVPNLREEAKRIIPRLIFLNGQRIRPEPDGERCAEASSTHSSETSSSSGSFSSIEKSLESFNVNPVSNSHSAGHHGPSNGLSTPTTAAPQTIVRPATADGLPLSQHQQQKWRIDRPLSAGLFRLREKHMLLCSTPTSPVTTYNVIPEFNFDKQFPARFPQTAPPVELELGVIGSLLDRSQSVFAVSSDTTSLLRLAQQWRKLRKNNIINHNRKRPESAGEALAKQALM